MSREYHVVSYSCDVLTLSLVLIATRQEIAADAALLSTQLVT